MATKVPTLRSDQSPEMALKTLPSTINKSKVSKATSSPIRRVSIGAKRPLSANPRGGSIPKKDTAKVDSSTSSRIKGIMGESEATTERRFTATNNKPTRARILPCSGFILGKWLFLQIGVNY
jgi:hypothetical protein